MSENTAVEKKVAKMLMVGCIAPEAKEVIDQQLNRRLAELDPEGLQTKFIMRLKNDLDMMPSCELGEEETGNE